MAIPKQLYNMCVWYTLVHAYGWDICVWYEYELCVGPVFCRDIVL